MVLYREKRKREFYSEVRGKVGVYKNMLGCKKDVGRDWVKLYGSLFTFFL